LLFTIHLASQNTIVGYQYAFNDGDGGQYVSITPTTDFNLNTSIDVSNLQSNINVFHIRFLDDEGLWSSMLSHIFIKPPQVSNPDKNIIAYEYAFNDGEGIQYVAITPTNDFNLVADIDVSNLQSNINVFHIRFLDDEGLWSSMLSHIFIKPPQVSNPDKNIIAYEYAFNDGEGTQYVAITPTNDFNLVADIDVSNLQSNINVFHIRFLDDEGLWSSMLSHIFIKPPQVSNPDKNIIAYEYAFNDGEETQYVSITPTNDFNLVVDIDVSNLQSNINVFHIRFLDDEGLWSSMLSHIFIKPPQVSNPDKNIIAYEYAFNDGEGIQYVAITPTNDFNLVADIDISNLQSNINVFHIRFLDDEGLWSSMLSHIFIKPLQSDNLLDNKLVSYAYWFDDEDTNKVEVDIDPDVTDFFIQELDMRHIWRGEHTIHTQFKDVYGKQSLVTTDTITKHALPIASFIVDKAEICIGETINFTSTSIDYDAQTWDFGDGETAISTIVAHTYEDPGIYTVNLDIEETGTSQTSNAQRVITVKSLLDNTVNTSTNIPACFGNVVTLTANQNDASYLWSNGATTQSIDIVDIGAYSVEIYYDNGERCTVFSDDIAVSFYPEIDNSITVENFPVVLIANQDNATYQWMDCNTGLSIPGATQITYQPTYNGDFAVEVTQNGCIVTSNCENVSTLSIADNAIKKIVKLYPNPVKNELFIQTDIPIIMELYNVTGQFVKKERLSIGVTVIRIDNLSIGLYYAKITPLQGDWKNRQAIYKIIKK